MSEVIETFREDDEYPLECTGDACAGDEIKFIKSIFNGVYPDAVFSHHIVCYGLIVKDSYGKTKQQHTFTILYNDGTKGFIKGRNIYRYRTFRKPWGDEDERVDVLREKHCRGIVARKRRQERIDREFNWKPRGADDFTNAE